MKKVVFVSTMGFALFSMFFGAGNLVYPLELGQSMPSQVTFLSYGFILTAVLMPLLGFLTVVLLEGDYRALFTVFGKKLGSLVALIILAVMGPFGGIPRCIALSYAGFQQVVPSCAVWLFGLVFCLAIFFAAVKETSIVGLLGRWLTPILLTTLALLLGYGLLSSNPVVSSGHDWKAFYHGILKGYHTLDLVAALFFSSFIYPQFTAFAKGYERKYAFIASVIAGILLSIVYMGFCSVAASHVDIIKASPELFLVSLAEQLFGPFGNYLVALLIVLACFTTALAIAAIVSDFIQLDLLGNRYSYKAILGVVLGISLMVGLLEFQAIGRLLGPILFYLYPFLIVLCLFVFGKAFFGKRSRGPLFKAKRELIR